ncbi:MAG TPA: hypothetical protein VMR97_05315, partial [Acidimicrobiales bacterium]|nr:hypothetical protein [Acidimicrobiales bacterium]
RAGLGVLAGAYRDRLAQAGSDAAPQRGERVRSLVAAIAAVDQVAAELVRNPNETLMLEALMVRLSAVTE